MTAETVRLQAITGVLQDFWLEPGSAHCVGHLSSK